MQVLQSQGDNALVLSIGGHGDHSVFVSFKSQHVFAARSLKQTYIEATVLFLQVCIFNHSCMY